MKLDNLGPTVYVFETLEAGVFSDFQPSSRELDVRMLNPNVRLILCL